MKLCERVCCFIAGYERGWSLLSSDMGLSNCPDEEAVKKVVSKNLFSRPRWSGDIGVKLWKSLLHSICIT